MFKYESQFSSEKPVIFIDSEKYEEFEAGFRGSSAVKNLDFKIIMERLARSAYSLGFSKGAAASIADDYGVPTFDLDEIRARQEAIGEIYENSEIEERVSTIIKSANNLHSWTPKFREKRIFAEKTQEVGYLVDLIESSLGLEAKSKRLQGVREFALGVSESKEYQLLKRFVSGAAEGLFERYRETLKDLSGFSSVFESKYTTAEMITYYRQLSSKPKSYNKKVNLLGFEERRATYHSIKKLQEIFRQLMNDPELEGIIDREEAKGLGLEKQLDFAVKTLSDTAILNFRQKAKIGKAQQYFLKGFADLLSHIDKLVEEGLDKLMGSLEVRTGDMENELAFYYSMARLAHGMGEVTMPRLVPMEERRCAIRGGRVASFVLRGDEMVANDFHSDRDYYSFLLTGANDNGKTTFERMVGQIQVLAQMGGYVPASEVELSMVDGVFTSFSSKDKPDKKEGSFRSSLNFLGFITKPSVIWDYDDEGWEIIDNPSAEIVKKAVAAGWHRFFTPHSLLLLDEIAIGSDNQATEEALERVLKAVGQRGARLLLSTHYHPVAEKVQGRVFANTMNLGAIMEIDDDGKYKETYCIERDRHEESLGHRLFEEAGFTDEAIDRATQLLIESGIVDEEKS
ncbi:hypothetical protein KY306_01395 [Candidatus Woesearchaeota archaeon]|nr:hypothetical protein [Candidatus Woesearchaeota archaeon]